MIGWLRTYAHLSAATWVSDSLSIRRLFRGCLISAVRLTYLFSVLPFRPIESVGSSVVFLTGFLVSRLLELELSALSGLLPRR